MLFIYFADTTMFVIGDDRRFPHLAEMADKSRGGDDDDEDSELIKGA